MSDFTELVVKCRDNLKRRRLGLGTIQMIVLTKEEEAVIAELDFVLRNFCRKIGEMSAQSTSERPDESGGKEQA